MTFRLLSFVRATLVLVLLFTLVLSGQAPAAAASGPSEPFSPVFIENTGQFADSARFQVLGRDLTLWLAEDAIWLTLFDPGVDRAAGLALSPENGANVKLSFPGANPHPRLEPFNRLATRVSYFTGSDPSRWRADVPVWGGVRYVDLYPGINLELTDEQGKLASRLVAQPGADLGVVRLRVEGPDVVVLSRQEAMLRLSIGAVSHSWPLLRTEAVTPEAAVRPLGPLAFEITAPFARVPLPLPGAPTPADNPADLLSSTFLGGSDSEAGLAVATDAGGAVYVTGRTRSSDFPTTAGAFDTSYNEGYLGDAFVARLNTAGSALDYATFLGGTGNDAGRDIAVDTSGGVYVAGQTLSQDFPTTPGAFDTTYNGGNFGDAFVVKLNADGSGLDYATFVGGSGDEYGQDDAPLGFGLAVNESGQAYIASSTSSPDFPTTSGAFDTSFNGGVSDVFVAGLNAAGSNLIYATFIGGPNEDVGTGITVDVDGRAYIVGWTFSSLFPTTPGAFDTIRNAEDGFVLRLSPTGDTLEYSTFLGGSDYDEAFAVTIDDSGVAYVAGTTNSSDFPATPDAFDSSFNGGSDAFIAKLDADGSALVWATFLGGSELEQAWGIAVDGSGGVCVAGYTLSPNFPTTPSGYDTTINGDADVFATRLDPPGTDLNYSTFLGGAFDDIVRDFTRNESGTATIVGWSSSSNFPTTPGAFDRTLSGVLDAVVVRLAVGVTTYSVSGQVMDGDSHGIPDVSIAATGGFSTTTDASGTYTLTKLLPGAYAVTPTLEGYSFDPITRTLDVPPDATGQDFVGSPLTYSISGQVTDVDDNPMPNVTITVAGSYSTTTDALGVYTLTELLSGAYVLTPILADYHFEPVTRTVGVPPDATGQDFRGELVKFNVYLPLVIRKE